MEASFFLDRWPTVRRIGGFDVIADIGRSGIADLYLALAPEKDGRRSRVVIKHLPDNDDDEDERAMFLDEARLARKLSHPNLIRTIDVGKDGRSYYIVAECLDGQLLSRLRKRSANKTPIPIGIELRMASEVLMGLHYLHELRDDDGVSLDVVHRDVTPHRVFVTYDGEVKIADFAIAKASVRQAETHIGVVKGDLLYFAPEVLRRQPVDRRADIFAVGMMLWEAAAGRRFWAGFSTSEIHHRLLAGDLPRETAPPDVPEGVLDIIQQAMEPDPGRRFATAHAMRQAIDEYLGDRPDASKAAISGYVQRAFIEERRRFYQSARAAEDRVQGRRTSVAVQSPAPPAASPAPLAAAPAPLATAPAPLATAPAPLAAIDSETLIRVVPRAAADVLPASAVVPPAAIDVSPASVDVAAPADAPPATLPAAELSAHAPQEQAPAIESATSSTLSTSFAQPTWRPPTASPHPPRRASVLILCLGAAAMLAAGWALAQVRVHARPAVVASPSAPMLSMQEPVDPSEPKREASPVDSVAASSSPPSTSALAKSPPRPMPHPPATGGAQRRTVAPKSAPTPQGDPFGI
jgi:serine/threonine-protein kinase